MSKGFETPKCPIEGPYEGEECICAADCPVYGQEGSCSNQDCKGPVKFGECDPPSSPCLDIGGGFNDSQDDESDEFGLSDDPEIPYNF